MIARLEAAGACVIGRAFPARQHAAIDLALETVALAIAYVIAAQVGYAFVLVNGNASPIWPPAGIAAAAMLGCGSALWPGVLAGGLIANLAHGVSPLGAVLASVGATAEALVAVSLLRRAAFRPQLDRLVDVPLLALVAGTSSVVGASIGSVGLVAGGAAASADLPLAWTAWAAGDALSIVVLGSFLMTWSAPPASDIVRRRPREAVAAVAVVVTVSVVLFFDVFNLRAAGESIAFPLIPVVVWVAFRIGPRGNALGAVLFSTIAILATEEGLGPLVGVTHAGSMFYAVAFISVTSVTGAAVAAVVAERESSGGRLTAATLAANDALSKLQALEVIGRRLAGEGPTGETLDAVIGLLAGVFGYAYPSIYIGDERVLRLGAQRGYAEPVLEIRPDRGVVGRVMRTRETVLLPDVNLEPSFIRADPAIRSEIAVPLMSGAELLGVLNVESVEQLGEADVSSVALVADRVAAALALAREREGLAARAAILRRLVAYAEQIGQVLASDELYPLCVAALQAVVPADLVGLTVRDRASGGYVVRAEHGSAGAVGRIIRPGEGVSGRAIQERHVVRIAGYGQDAFPPAIAAFNEAAVYADAVGVPLLRDEEAVGSLTVARVDEARRFSDLELEALALLADVITLAVVNASLHGEVADLAVHDALTGLHNRGYFDGAFLQIIGRRGRTPPEHRAPLAAVMFDLDHFGDFNKQHGHPTGDDVLRVFGVILRRRLRRSDLVARYGGEEFIAILPGATRDQAVRVADEIREALSRATVRGATGQVLTVTVSAGCAQLDDADLDGAALIRAADTALAMAKRAGRNVVVAA